MITVAYLHWQSPTVQLSIAGRFSFFAGQCKKFCAFSLLKRTETLVQEYSA